VRSTKKEEKIRKTRGLPGESVVEKNKNVNLEISSWREGKDFAKKIFEVVEKGDHPRGLLANQEAADEVLAKGRVLPIISQGEKVRRKGNEGKTDAKKGYEGFGGDYPIERLKVLTESADPPLKKGFFSEMAVEEI